MAIRIELNERLNEATGNRVPLATIYRGKSLKGECFRFRSFEHREGWIHEQHADDERSTAFKAELKATKLANTAAMRAAVVVGSIFVNTWGYDQTQVDAYQVIAKTKSGASVTLRRVCTATQPESEGMMCDRVKPIADDFADESDPFVKRLTDHGISFDHGSASLHDGERDYYRSWYA